MPYYVTKSDGSTITVLDGTKDTTSTSLTLFGRLVTNYGDQTNENFVRLLENFAYTNNPSFPITGQLWFDTANNLLKVYTTANTWVTVGSGIQGNLDVTGNILTSNLSIIDTNSNISFINRANAGNVSFFTNVAGTSTRSIHVNGSTGLVETFANATNNFGLVTKIYVDSLNDIVLANLAIVSGNIITINANIGAYQTFANSNASTQATSISDLTANLSSYQLYANTALSDLSTNVNAVFSGTGSVDAKDIKLNSNVVMNNSGVGNTVVNFQTPGGITFLSAYGTNTSSTPVTIQGQWQLGFEANINATYADLAEFYEGDTEYEPGTVLVFGGEKEVTISTFPNDTRVVGVVTSNPAYVMNSQQTGTKVCVALVGRIPCRVNGSVKKGDLLTTSVIPGCAEKANNPMIGAIIGKAIEDKADGSIGMIQVFVGKG